MSNKEDLESLPKTKKEAKEKGEKFFFTGVPCKKRGHIAKRDLTDYCNECKRERDHELYLQNREARLERQKRYYRENREQRLEYMRNYYIKNKPKIQEYWQSWYDRKSYIVKERALEYKFKKSQAFPMWASYEKDLIKEIYLLKDILNSVTDVPHQVDHIIPINSEFVCGLHCYDNLQILTRTQNIKKQNKFDPDQGYS